MALGSNIAAHTTALVKATIDCIAPGESLALEYSLVKARDAIYEAADYVDLRVEYLAQSVEQAVDSYEQFARRQLTRVVSYVRNATTILEHDTRANMAPQASQPNTSRAPMQYVTRSMRLAMNDYILLGRGIVDAVSSVLQIEDKRAAVASPGSGGRTVQVPMDNLQRSITRNWHAEEERSTDETPRSRTREPQREKLLRSSIKKNPMPRVAPALRETSEPVPTPRSAPAELHVGSIRNGVSERPSATPERMTRSKSPSNVSKSPAKGQTQTRKVPDSRQTTGSAEYSLAFNNARASLDPVQAQGGASTTLASRRYMSTDRSHVLLRTEKRRGAA
jgi:hypothetical protein